MEEFKSAKQINHLQNLWFVIGLFLTAISTIIIICSSYIFVQFIVKPNSPPTIFGVSPQIIMTNDMSGNNVGHIEKGDLVFIKKVPVEKIEVQNIVAYVDNGNILVSRVTGIAVSDKTILSIRADNIEEEYLIDDSQVLGEITQRVASFGGFIYFTQSVIGVILFVIIPSLVLITLLILKIISKKKNANKDKTDSDAGKSNEPPKQESSGPVWRTIDFYNTHLGSDQQTSNQN